jgi:CheY-like chemotaxis protein
MTHDRDPAAAMTTSAGPSLEDSLLPGPVLVVEDEPLTQARLRDVLVSLGYTGDALLFGGNITQAHTLIAEQPFALALIDVGLPDGNGIDLIRTLLERDPALPILVIRAQGARRTRDFAVDPQRIARRCTDRSVCRQAHSRADR